jgi:ArsR family transcriptional regulator, virulence genes transcriptional regulator
MDVNRIEQSAREAAMLLKAISNPQRLLILCHLAEGEKSVGQIEAQMQIAQPRLSQQLARLRRDGLVRARRDSRTIYYALGDRRARQLIAHLYDLFCAAPAEPAGRDPARDAEGLEPALPGRPGRGYGERRSGQSKRGA